MKISTLFDTKNRFSEVCSQVANTGEPVTVTRRGKPVVRIVPIEQPSQSASVWDTVDEASTRFGPLTEDFELPVRNPTENRPDPLSDE